FLLTPPPPPSTLFPYTTLFRSLDHIFEAAVEALRPDVHLVAHADKLRGNAHMRTGLAHATFQHIVDTHLVPNLVDALAAVLVFHCRRARDNSKPVRIHRAEL